MPIASAVLPQTKRTFTGSQLKWIAIVTMAIDHLAASPLTALYFATEWQSLPLVISLMRFVGRLAFPIFCFLLVEGFLHTSNVRRYLAQMGIFALISEIPFDFAISRVWLEFRSQNVFFTLFFGLLALICLRKFEGHVALQTLCVLGFCLFAQVLGADYGLFGIVLIVLFYLLHDKPKARALCVTAWMFLGMIILAFLQFGALGFLGMYSLPILLISAINSAITEGVGALSLLLIQRYNGEKGHSLPKYFFYAFYPAHLFLLGLLSLGIQNLL